ncbi:unnamed protein product, partial [Allacma fusca]
MYSLLISKWSQMAPSYFPPVVSQPLGMGNSESYPMSSFQPEIPGQHLVQVGPLAPVPYQNQAVYPGQYVQPSNFQMVPDIANLIDGILAREIILSFHSNQSIGSGANSLIVQIRGSQNQLVMSTLMTSVAVLTRYVSDNTSPHTVYEYGRTITFNDTTGKSMMTCKQFRNVRTILFEAAETFESNEKSIDPTDTKNVLLILDDGHSWGSTTWSHQRNIIR